MSALGKVLDILKGLIGLAGKGQPKKGKQVQVKPLPPRDDTPTKPLGKP